jgi:magnesium-transporting ATPase (P-type)
MDRLPHTLTPDGALAAVGSDRIQGIADGEAVRRVERFGPNALPERRRRSLVSVFLHQFQSPLIYLLLVAAGVAAVVGHRTDPLVILAVVLINAVIGTLQEGRAERSLAALRRLAGNRAQVVRDGTARVVEAREVVPGDILLLAAGDAVAADARLLEAVALQVAEAALTGESVGVTKNVEVLSAETLLADRRNMVHAGTYVTAGRGRAVVMATGLNTEIGHIAALAESAAQPATPLERRIAQFGRWIVVAAVALFGVILALGLMRGLPAGEVVMVGISQLVGMIPEGLPVAMTIALAIGVQRMAGRRAVVRRLAAVETLGSTTVICTDKTGTLTANEMTVTAVWLSGVPLMEVTGAGYAPSGDIHQGSEAPAAEANVRLRDLLETGVLCGDGELRAPAGADGGWQAVGDPTEVALVTVAMKGGLDPSAVRARHPRTAEIPFDPGAKMMATQHGAGAEARVLLKGAPEEILDLCAYVRGPGGLVPLDENQRSEIRAVAQQLASRALRLLAFAVVEGEPLRGPGFDDLRGKACLLGLMGQMDPPRPEVRDAVARCRQAGIRPVMVTGDHRATGLAIALELGIVDRNDPPEVAVDGRELEAMTDAALAERIARISVFARVHPAQKLRIVQAYQKRGEVVAMTGDGVNDAPALVAADVGVAMGKTGTDVAKQAAKIVVTDDNFATIVAAVEEGRVVYRNIKKAILLLFTTSLAEVLVLLLALLLGYPPPLAAVQILWNNLVTEGVITINLIMDPAEGDEMRRGPVHPGEPLISRGLLGRAALMTPTIVACTLGWFVWRTAAGVPLAVAQSETFALLAVCEWFNVLNCRSERRSALSLSLLKNPWLIGGLVLGNLLQAAVIYVPALNGIFHTVPIGWKQFLLIGLVGSTVLWVEELRKLLARRAGDVRTDGYALALNAARPRPLPRPRRPPGWPRPLSPASRRH